MAEEWFEIVCAQPLERLRGAIANAADITAGCVWRERELERDDSQESSWLLTSEAVATMNTSIPRDYRNL